MTFGGLFPQGREVVVLYPSFNNRFNVTLWDDQSLGFFLTALYNITDRTFNAVLSDTQETES